MKPRDCFQFAHASLAVLPCWFLFGNFKQSFVIFCIYILMLLIPSILQDVVKYAVFLKKSIWLNFIYFESFSFFKILLLIKFVGFHTLSKFDVFR